MPRKLPSNWPGGMGPNGRTHAQNVLPHVLPSFAHPGIYQSYSGVAGVSRTTQSREGRTGNYRPLAAALGIAVSTAGLAGGATLAMLPKLVETLGPDGTLIAVTLFLLMGGVATFMIWWVLRRILAQYIALTRLVVEEKHSLRRDLLLAYKSGRNDEREAEEERTPPEGIKKQ